MRPSPEVERLLPGEEDVAFYEEHGYYVTPKALPDDVIDAASRGAERHWAGERDWRLPVSSGFGDWKPGDGDTIRNSEYTALQNREIRALVQHPIIGAIAGRLTRSSEIRRIGDESKSLKRVIALRKGQMSRPMVPGKARRSGPTGAPREVPFQLGRPVDTTAAVATYATAWHFRWRSLPPQHFRAHQAPDAKTSVPYNMPRCRWRSR